MPRKKKKAKRLPGSKSKALKVDADSLRIAKGGVANLEFLANLDDVDIDFRDGKLCITADVTKCFSSSKTTLVMIEFTPSALAQLAAYAVCLSNDENLTFP